MISYDETLFLMELQKNNMTYAETTKFLVAMIVMLNPLSSLSIFLQLTHKTSLIHQRQTALECCFAMIVIMIVTVWTGKQLLDILGITISSFRFAGGIILLLVGLSMLQSQESPVNYNQEDNVAAKKRESIAVVPLALPIILGPGAISTLVIAANDYPGLIYKCWISILCVGLAISMGLILYYSNIIIRVIGQSMIKVITRIMGMIVMSIAVNMLSSGLIGLLPALGING